MLEKHYVYVGNKRFAVKADVPKRCRFVWDCVRGASLPTSHVRLTGAWRYIDLQKVTGHSSSDVKMRELARLNPKLFEVKKVQSESSAARYATYKLRKGVLMPAAQHGGGR